MYLKRVHPNFSRNVRCTCQRLHGRLWHGKVYEIKQRKIGKNVSENTNFICSISRENNSGADYVQQICSRLFASYLS